MTPESIDPQAIKRQSEATVLGMGGKICDWLPVIEFTNARDLKPVVGRALVLNAMFQIYLGAPTDIIRGWLDEQSLSEALSAKERDILARSAEALTEEERINLYWYVEALWAFLWATGLIEAMPFDRGVEDFMASLCPNLQCNEDGSKFRQRMKLRSYAELYAMRDLAYRCHWWTEDGRMNGYETAPVSGDIVMERRRALEWILDREQDWDDVNMST